jgi:hypothetical protein
MGVLQKKRELICQNVSQFIGLLGVAFRTPQIPGEEQLLSSFWEATEVTTLAV